MNHDRNPDLIFEKVSLERMLRLSSLYPHIGSSMWEPGLDRVTLFVTHRCNLSCSYCNGPHLDKKMDPEKRKLMLKSDLSFERYTKLFDDWVGNGVSHIHFTGGEPTLNVDLDRMVKLASEHSIAATLTTNGTADFDVYKRLVDYGLSEFRISIDSANEVSFDKIVGVNGAGVKVKKNIENLVNMRDKERKDIFVILNACVGSFNINVIKDSMKSLNELNPDDIKFLVVAEDSESVHSHASRKKVDELLASVDSLGRDYSLLKKKVRALFRKDSFGLKDNSSKYLLNHCFIPLAERTLDANGIYPCSIYLRYKGDPVISSDAKFGDQQKALYDFVQNHDCRNDKICVDNCTGCCKQFNLSMNRKIRARSELLSASKDQVIEIGSISDKAVHSAVRTFKKISGLSTANDLPFLVIKPEGMSYESEIKKYLAEQNVGIVNELDINDWSAFSLFLYFGRTLKKRVQFRLARNKAYSQLELGNSARYIAIDKAVPEAKLFRIKTEFRDWYFGKRRYFSYKNERVLIDMNCVHAPDYKDLPYQNKVVKYFLGI